MKKSCNTKKCAIVARGMSLIESLVAIAILLTVTTAVMSTAQGSLQTTYYSRDQITAFYLAQEANEYVRNTRDSNTLEDGAEWNRYLDQCVGQSCTIDTSETPNNGGLSVCVGACPYLQYDPATYHYGYDLGTESQFRRYVTLGQPGSNSDELRVTTTVEWKAGIRDREVVVESLIYNWE
jgi:prepilin-type N-terminal cleavage/methylation domain-containing protein